MSATVEIDPGSGFCFGVVNAIRKAEEELEKGGSLYCLGDIVHNSDEVARLSRRGLVSISHSDLDTLPVGSRVLLRAHGEPPSTYIKAKERRLTIIDATCPVVLKLQQRISRASKESDEGTQIVIYGKHGHAEVNGLVGQTDGKAIVVERSDELEKIDRHRPVMLFSQTTKSLGGMRQLSEIIANHLAPGISFTAYDTICRQVASRAQGLREFALRHDVVIFVAGAKSSNGRALYNECKSVNPQTHLISNRLEIEPQWLTGAKSIGICGATSTPSWLMEEVARSVGRMQSQG
ncbi:MAG: 4-hydroxy-3-methylbut-2-enyl diphosphate reductase [Pseudoflavonifractor sp.]|nr:4-hydroxy-3-methylbut-2-enyl diphosphate reductase [Alloprevotella sp.]MCM1117047.1 4-hydroxy-3-methylbut-2-enyl diphosphate reductase [Pseudoflavonifractor sp.]